MKVLRSFRALCKECGRDREYCETETDLGWIDVACILWCACDPQKLVTGVPSKPLVSQNPEICEACGREYSSFTLHGCRHPEFPAGCAACVRDGELGPRIVAGCEVCSAKVDPKSS